MELSLLSAVGQKASRYEEDDQHKGALGLNLEQSGLLCMNPNDEESVTGGEDLEGLWRELDTDDAPESLVSCNPDQARLLSELVRILEEEISGATESTSAAASFLDQGSPFALDSYVDAQDNRSAVTALSNLNYLSSESTEDVPELLDEWASGSCSWSSRGITPLECCMLGEIGQSTGKENTEEDSQMHVLCE